MTDSRLDNRPEPVWENDEQGGSLPLMDYLQLLWFRRKLIIAVTIFVSVIGYIQINEIKNVYSATSTLMIGLPQANLVDIEAVFSPRDDAETEMEVLRSRVLAAKVIN